MNGFAFAPLHNSPASALMVGLGNAANCIGDEPAHGRAATHVNDATGGFQIGMGNFSRIHQLPQAQRFLYDNQLPQARRAESIFDALSACAGGLEVVAYFGHGLPNAMASAGIGADELPRFAGLIEAKAAMDVAVVFYGCNLGKPGGFASQLAQLLARKRGRTYGHTTFGHYAQNAMHITVGWPGGRPVGTHSAEDLHPWWARFWQRDQPIGATLRTQLAGL